MVFIEEVRFVEILTLWSAFFNLLFIRQLGLKLNLHLVVFFVADGQFDEAYLQYYQYRLLKLCFDVSRALHIDLDNR